MNCVTQQRRLVIVCAVALTVVWGQQESLSQLERHVTQQSVHELVTLFDEDGKSGIVGSVTRDAMGRIVGVFFYSNQATDERIQIISAIPTIQSIRIGRYGTRMTAASLAPLRRMNNLQHLSICRPGNMMTVEMWNAISSASNLQSLTVGCTSLKDAGLGKLSRLPKLRKLFFLNCGDLSEKQFEELVELKHLEDLDINNTHITDACLDIAARLPSLRRLGVGGSGVSLKAISLLKHATGIEVHGDPN